MKYNKDTLQNFVYWFALVIKKYKEQNGVDQTYKNAFKMYTTQLTKIVNHITFEHTEITQFIVYTTIDITLDFYNEHLKPKLLTEQTSDYYSRKLTIYKNNNLQPEVKKFLIHFTAWTTKRLGLTSQFNVIFSKKGQINGISTGGFDPSDNSVISRIEGRAPIDCVRTIAHELVHLKQKEDGKIQDGVPVQDIGGDIENEANAMAGVLVKEYAAKFGRWIYEL